MESLSIKKLADLDASGRDQAVEIFTDAFLRSLQFMSKDQTRLTRALRHAFVGDQFYTAVENGKVLGIFAYSTNRARAFSFDKQIFQKEFGRIKGSFIYKVLHGELGKPLDFNDRQCYFESVATAREARGRGIATLLNNHLIDMLDFDEFILEVVDTNTSAYRLYEKLGYTEIKRKKQRLFPKLAGFNERIYMKRGKG
ncbi:hypothetical protein J25TS5_40980 [Paenibacillus faecis]|uniref:GNAT family N-acetyltransferase n=1 Tax=Paenibacillus faecis TaxID=862114 RepID=UPI001B08E59E|nr:GNAT family N-acetyltransferase [Paenibacillus faecis]GIO87166.1 hypothetical protein J25TS5_40980 [Paenibacillus faecis]